MTDNTLAVIVLVAFLVLVSGVVLWAKLRKPKKVVYDYPSTWTAVGIPPAHSEKALEVIKECLPGWTGNYGGVIEWVSEPFMMGSVRAAGGVMDFNVPRIKVMYFPDVSQTALAHEIRHLYDRVYNNEQVCDGDPKLYKWVNETNAKIKAAVS